MGKTDCNRNKNVSGAADSGGVGGLRRFAWLLAIIFLCGCGARHPVYHHPPHHELEPVPGHPGYHFGSEHLECDTQNNCALVRSWLRDKDNEPVLSANGCWVTKHLYFTRLFGDKPSMCLK